jgi:hypothetical protein
MAIPGLASASPKLVWLEQTSFVQEDPFGRPFIPKYFAETSGNKIGGSLV